MARFNVFRADPGPMDITFILPLTRGHSLFKSRARARALLSRGLIREGRVQRFKVPFSLFQDAALILVISGTSLIRTTIFI